MIKTLSQAKLYALLKKHKKLKLYVDQLHWEYRSERGWNRFRIMHLTKQTEFVYNFGTPILSGDYGESCWEIWGQALADREHAIHLMYKYDRAHKRHIARVYAKGKLIWTNGVPNPEKRSA